VSMRGNGFGTVQDYQRIANDNIVVCVQIESPTAVENIDAICKVEGIDSVFIGPSDLAASYGQLGNPNHPEVQAAMQTVVKRAKAAGVPVGTLAPVEADARRYMEMGITMVAVGSDLGVFRVGTQALRDKFAV
jgi:2-dehydro-3-deoxyglucarate aldolase